MFINIPFNHRHLATLRIKDINCPEKNVPFTPAFFIFNMEK